MVSGIALHLLGSIAVGPLVGFALQSFPVPATAAHPLSEVARPTELCRPGLPDRSRSLRVAARSCVEEIKLPSCVRPHAKQIAGQEAPCPTEGFPPAPVLFPRAPQ